MRGKQAHAQLTGVAFLPGSKMAEMAALDHVAVDLDFDWRVVPFHATRFCVVA